MSGGHPIETELKWAVLHLTCLSATRSECNLTLIDVYAHVVVQDRQLRFRLAYTVTFSDVAGLTGFHSLINFTFSWTWLEVWQDGYILYLHPRLFFKPLFHYYNQVRHHDAQFLKICSVRNKHYYFNPAVLV